MIYRINAGSISVESWMQDIEIGGGRIIGEVCHFIDYMVFLCGSLPVRIFASSLPDPHDLNDTVTINLEFKNGSIGSIIYVANGNDKMPKEYIEVHANGISAFLDDYRELKIFGSGKVKKKRLRSQDKGQKVMVNRFIDSLNLGKPPLIPTKDIFAVTRATLNVLKSLQTRQSIAMD